MLFLIYNNDLPSSLLSVPGFFAVNTALLIAGKLFKSVQMLANSELAKVSNWTMANNLIINTSKTVALFISANLRKPVTDLTSTFNNEIVYPSNTAKYLGILLDNELSLKLQMISLEKKITRSTGTYYCKS